MKENSKCAIWDTPVTKVYEDSDGYFFDSPRSGGRYFISGSAAEVLDRFDEQLKVRLTNWLVEQRRLGSQCPEITTYTIGEAKQWEDMSVSNRTDNILRYLEKKSKTLGFQVSHRIFSSFLHTGQLHKLEITYFELLSHSGCVNDQDLTFLLTYLNECGLIKYTGRDDEDQACTLTVEGYARLAELGKPYTVSSRAFVAMWLHGSMSKAWENGFKPAIRGAGFEPVRIDQQEHVNKIDDEIIAEIRRARFVVADFTQNDAGARGGVYYEAGFAHGFGIPVIFTCQKDSLGKIHFDTRQYNHIIWTEPEKLQKDLTRRISAVIGDGPKKSQNYKG